MKDQFGFEVEPFEVYSAFGGSHELFSEEQSDMEFDQEFPNGMRSVRQQQCPRCGASMESGDLTSEQEAPTPQIPPWINSLYRLYKAGRLGWKAGRWFDKWTGRVFGKPISDRGANFLYKRLGRSRRAEDFVDRLPRPIKRWLYSL
jgi:hypothetical protein